MLALGILLLLLGMTMLALSQFKEEIQPQETPEELAGEIIKQEGASSLSVQTDFIEGEIFSEDFALREWPSALPDVVTVDTNITDPFGNVTWGYVFVEIVDPTSGQWGTSPGSWTGTGVANYTGTYQITIFSDFVRLSRLTVKRFHLIPGKILYPYFPLYYPSAIMLVLGLVLSLFGALSSKTRRMHRAKLRRETSIIKRR